MERKFTDEEWKRIAVETLNRSQIALLADKNQYPELRIYIPPSNLESYLKRIGISPATYDYGRKDGHGRFGSSGAGYDVVDMSAEFPELPYTAVYGFSEIQKLADAGINFPGADLFRTPGIEPPKHPWTGRA